jgi:hypothetical protein
LSRNLEYISSAWKISFLIACMSFSEIENDALNRAELKEINFDKNNQIFKVPGQNEIPRRRTIIWP